MSLLSYRHVRKNLLTAVFLLLTPSLAMAQLAPEIQADRYLLSTQKNVSSGDHKGAIEDFEKILTLDVEVPDDFWFFYGESLNETGRFEDSKDAIIAYLNAAGQSGENYHQALELLDIIEPKAEQEVEAAEIKAKEEAENQELSSAINAAGFCTQTLLYDAGTKTHRKTVTVQDSYDELISIPATFVTDSETVVIKPSAPEGTSFKELQEIYVVQEAHAELSVVDAEHKVLEKTVNFGDDSKGQPMIETYQQRVLETPASSVERVLPAITKSYTTYEIKKKGKSATILPAVTKILTRRTVKSPSKIQMRKVPGITKQASFVETLSESYSAEADVICDYKNSPTLVKLLQEKFKKRNLYDGDTDGVWTPDLDEALDSFQMGESIGRGPYFSKEVLEGIGIKRR